jgi:undecaprenyl pyrophosphate synthase
MCDVLRYVELAERFLVEGRGLIDGDPVQAGEKLYRVAEEAVKAIAVALGLEEVKEALRRGRWTTKLLDDVVWSAGLKLGIKELQYLWDSAYKLHVDGFHEARLTSDEVIRRVEAIEILVNIAKKVVQQNINYKHLHK